MNALHHITTLYQLGHTRCGLPEQQIAAAEQRLNIRFPAVLRAYLLALGGSEAINPATACCRCTKSTLPTAIWY